ncbi:E3 ubiquitin-protein ligase RGLG4-like isoform X1 [Asparagus officinalis]|uniref:E3 ubiquitin-protein ligase RGLG4-like isoform X1 n=1 Tax=Asparagus officinalis TaxID=4686 RepID=UPI00098E1B72|nr:E3 ubiquitin-protein ligase RGLG4-like isoform X1 [Asparagus officinalis]
MGNAIGGLFHRGRRNQRSGDVGRQPSARDVGRRQPSARDVGRQPSTRNLTSQQSVKQGNSNQQRRVIAKKYSYIPDNYTSLEQVTAALRESGLESSNLIVGIDFTKSNEWTGKYSFNNQSLHTIGDRPNPYEQAISIVGKTLAPFDEDNLIPCFGFGDATTHDKEVFSFHSDNSPCHGFEEVLACYRRIAPRLKLSGPTSFAPIVEAAVDIVERSGGQYHVLIIIADGQVTRSVDTDMGALSPQEEKTINSIVTASSYPLSIILVGVGDGPWEDMKRFDDKIPARDFDNFQMQTQQRRKLLSPSLLSWKSPFNIKPPGSLDCLGNIHRIWQQLELKFLKLSFPSLKFIVFTLYIGCSAGSKAGDRDSKASGPTPSSNTKNPKTAIIIKGRN